MNQREFALSLEAIGRAGRRKRWRAGLDTAREQRRAMKRVRREARETILATTNAQLKRDYPMRRLHQAVYEARKRKLVSDDVLAAAGFREISATEQRTALLMGDK